MSKNIKPPQYPIFYNEEEYTENSASPMFRFYYETKDRGQHEYITEYGLADTNSYGVYHSPTGHYYLLIHRNIVEVIEENFEKGSEDFELSVFFGLF